MSGLYIPDFSEILECAECMGQNSEAPELWAGLVGLWPFAVGGGLTAFDVSGYGNHGTLTNMDPATDWVMTERGWALAFGGADACVDIPMLVLSTNADSTIAWWGTRNADGDHAIAGSRADYKRIMWLDSNDELFIETDTNANQASSSSQPSSYDGLWHHAAIVTRAGEAFFYFDGADVGQGTYTAKLTNTTTIEVFGADKIGAPSYEYNGRLNNICAWPTRALLPSEISQLYSDPWAMYRLRSKPFPAAVAPGGIVVPWHLLLQGAA